MNTQLGADLGFYTHMGFAHFQDAQTRFKMIGGAVWRRPPALGAVMDISLAAVVLESFSTQDPATRNQCRWLCPMGAAFQSIPGMDVCFAATMMHMLLSSPQMVAHFSGYAHRPHSIGSLIGRCLAHMWRSRTQEDPDGPILISLIRQRLTGDFGHVTGRSKSTREPVQSFLGQQDMNELEMALGQALTEDLPCAREEDGRESLGQPTSYAELINSRATEVRYCRKCGPGPYRSRRWLGYCPFKTDRYGLCQICSSPFSPPTKNRIDHWTNQDASVGIARTERTSSVPRFVPLRQSSN